MRRNWRMELDDEVFFLGEDIGESAGGVFKCFKGMQTKWGERVRPTPDCRTGDHRRGHRFRAGRHAPDRRNHVL